MMKRDLPGKDRVENLEDFHSPELEIVSSPPPAYPARQMNIAKGVYSIYLSVAPT